MSLPTNESESDDRGAVIYSTAQVAQMATSVQTLAKYFDGKRHGKTQYDPDSGNRITPTLDEAEDSLATLAGALGTPLHPKPTRQAETQATPNAL